MFRMRIDVLSRSHIRDAISAPEGQLARAHTCSVVRYSARALKNGCRFCSASGCARPALHMPSSGCDRLSQ